VLAGGAVSSNVRGRAASLTDERLGLAGMMLLARGAR
jgi:hypothetical protein